MTVWADATDQVPKSGKKSNSGVKAQEKEPKAKASSHHSHSQSKKLGKVVAAEKEHKMSSKTKVNSWLSGIEED